MASKGYVNAADCLMSKGDLLRFLELPVLHFLSFLPAASAGRSKSYFRNLAAVVAD